MTWTKVKLTETDIAEALEGVDLTPAERLEANEKNNVEAMSPTHFPSGVEISKTKIEVIKKPVVRKAKLSSSSHDPVNHPKHYTEHPSGIECIQITEHMGFNLGNAMKYIWRADLKHNAVEDLQKAVWYINREIEKREKS